MIKIVKGVYGFMDENGIVRPKTAADEPFELLPEQEARLVKLGIAEYVGNAGTEQDQEDGTEQEGTEQDQEDGTEQEGTEQDQEDGTEQEPIGFGETPPADLDLSALSVPELRKVGKEYGLTFKVGTTKDDMVKAIEAAEAALYADAEDEDGESAPVFDASEAVQ